VWGHLFIFVSTVASIYVIYKEYGDNWPDYQLSLLGAVAVWLLSQVIYALDFDALKSLPDILLVFANSILLTSFLILIRIMKPEFFRYPYQFIFVPFLLPLAYLLVLNSSIMQSLIFFSMHVVSIGVFIILAIGYWDYLKHSPILPVASMILLILSFLIYWLLEDFHTLLELFGQICLSAGMIFSVYTFSGVIKKVQSQN
jgi:drug/metabolite transporter (DMT)-like permease